MAAQERDDLHEVINGMTLDHCDLPATWIGTVFKTLIKGSPAQKIFADTPLEFAPGLLDVLRADEPPSVEFFLNLPQPGEESWVVYGVMVAESGCGEDPVLGTGSRTNRGNR